MVSIMTIPTSQFVDALKRWRPWVVRGLLCSVFCISQAAAQTPLRIDITGVGTRQIPVAVAPFDSTEPALKFSRTITDVIRADLARSGVISIVDAGTPTPA